MKRPKTPSEVGQLLRMAREIGGFTLRDVDVATGINNGLLSQIETGHIKNPSFETVVLIAHAIALPIEVLASKITAQLPQLRKRRRDAGKARRA
jgi:transcriptional regulator with XRE-family HTH domain